MTDTRLRQAMAYLVDVSENSFVEHTTRRKLRQIYFQLEALLTEDAVTRPARVGGVNPSPLEVGAAVDTALRLGWDPESITLAGWIAHNVKDK